MFPAEINKFVSNIQKFGELSRSDRFRVLIPLPVSFGPTGESSDLLTLRCEDAELPGKSFSTFDVRTYGPIQRFPNLTTYNDITLTFLCSANIIENNEIGFFEKMIFENWMDTINPTPNKTSNSVDIAYHNFNYKKSYQTDITIEHYDLYDKLNYSVKLIDAFPISINQITLAWGNDQIARLSVTFAYTRWQRETFPMYNRNFAATGPSQGSIVDTTQNPRNTIQSILLNQGPAAAAGETVRRAGETVRRANDMVRRFLGQ